jgi:hypothetical protein
MSYRKRTKGDGTGEATADVVRERENMSEGRRKLSLGQVILVSLGCGLIMVLLIFGVQIATGNQEVNRIPILKTAAVMGLFTMLGAAYICLKHFWDRSR